jgi:hypothetical protein
METGRKKNKIKINPYKNQTDEENNFWSDNRYPRLL